MTSEWAPTAGYCYTNTISKKIKIPLAQASEQLVSKSGTETIFFFFVVVQTQTNDQKKEICVLQFGWHKTKWK